MRRAATRRSYARREGWAFNGRVLIERDREVERLLELLADAVDGEGRLVFVGGEAGVGKTSLMSAVAAAAPSGVEVRWGAADADCSGCVGRGRRRLA